MRRFAHIARAGQAGSPGGFCWPSANESESPGLMDLIGGPDVEIGTVSDGAAALEELNEGQYDLMVLGWDQPDVKAFDLIDEFREQTKLADLPILLYSAQPHTQEGRAAHQAADANDAWCGMCARRSGCSTRFRSSCTGRLAQMTEERRQVLNNLHQAESVLAGKKVLVVDDDIRNIFAMTSILEPYQMQVISAETGRAAIEILQHNPDIDLVLMDIMMPDMDGYDTMRAIRKLSKFRALPIIALTAKAMKGDREKCIEAGASDYISKPVDTPQLLGLLRLWLHR